MLREVFCRWRAPFVVLGDNLIERNIVQAAQAFPEQRTGAKILLKEVKDQQYLWTNEYPEKFIPLCVTNALDDQPLTHIRRWALSARLVVGRRSLPRDRMRLAPGRAGEGL